MAEAQAPDGIKLGRHRDLRGREWHPWARRVLLVLVGGILVLALFNVFGQRPSGAEAAGAAAKLKVYAPTRVRSGLLFEGRLTVEARQDLAKATLVLSQGWIEGITINTIEPAPIGEASRNGSLSFDLGHVPAGERFVLYMQFQVNPTTVGRRSQDVELYDGERKLLNIHRTITIWP